MNIHRLTLCDFRNIEKVEISPDSGFNIFWGINAQGKTNHLEAVYLLGNLKRFRGARNEEMIRHGRELSRLKGEVDCQGVRRRIELQIECHGKTGRVDGKESRSTGSFLGHLRPILFSPEEVNLIKGSPAGRRDLLDRAVFQADAAFLGRAQEYRRLLRQRNCLLRENRSRVEIHPWSEGLIRTGARIRHDRFIYIDRLLPLLREAYRNIAGGGEEADLQYTAGAPSVEKLEEALRRELERAEDRERKMGQTLAGPHRDDHRFMVNGRLLRLYGSQGQQRSFILAFKAAQIMDLENRTGEPPILLLDDMTSELDRQRQGFFFRYLQARQGQVFITTTDIRSLIDEGFRQARFYRVSGGGVEEDCRE
jgi:DNA replication and repair protein RecF